MIGENNGWIKLYFKLENWEWSSDFIVWGVFTHLLLLANREDKKWRGVTIKRGSFITSLNTLSKKIGISIQQLRTALTKLKSTHEVTQSSTAKYTCISINNYEKYQSSTQSATNKQQSSNKVATTTKEYKNIRNKEIYINILSLFNETTKKTFKVLDEKAVDYWTTIHTIEEIENAIRNIPNDDFWKDKMTPTILFRRKNQRGEAVDYIDQLNKKNLSEEEQMQEVAIALGFPINKFKLTAPNAKS